MQDGVERSERKVIELEPARRSEQDDPPVIDVVVRDVDKERKADSDASGDDLEPVGYYAGELIATLSIQTIKTSFLIGRALVQRASGTRTGRLVNQIATGMSEAVAADIAPDLEDAGRVAEEQLGRVVSVVVPVVVQSIDTDELLEHLDLNALLAAVDIEGLLGRIDLDAMLDQVDIARLIDRLDINSLLEHVDIGAMIERVDIEAVLDRIDLDQILADVDLEALLDRVDVAGLAKRANIGELVADSTSDVAGSVLDLGRRQAVGVDTLLAGVVNRLFGRDVESLPQGPAALLADDAVEEAGVDASSADVSAADASAADVSAADRGAESGSAEEASDTQDPDNIEVRAASEERDTEDGE